MTPKEFLAWILKVCDADARKSDKRFYDTVRNFAAAIGIEKPAYDDFAKFFDLEIKDGH